jgi:hypothetical protein
MGEARRNPSEKDQARNPNDEGSTKHQAPSTNEKGPPASVSGFVLRISLVIRAVSFDSGQAL